MVAFKSVWPLMRSPVTNTGNCERTASGIVSCSAGDLRSVMGASQALGAAS